MRNPCLLYTSMAGIGIGFNTMGNYESATQYGAATPYLAPGCYEGGAGYAMMFMAQRVELYIIST